MRKFIQSKDLVERLLYLTLLLVFIVAGFLFYNTIESNKRAIDQQTAIQKQLDQEAQILKGVQTLIKNQGTTTTEINKSLSCILVFFTTPNRTQFYISNLSTCEITNITNGQRQVLPLPEASPSSEELPRTTGGLQKSPSVSQAPTTSEPAPNTQQPTTPAPTEPAAEPPAAKAPISVVTPLLDEPICVLELLCVQ